MLMSGGEKWVLEIPWVIAFIFVLSTAYGQQVQKISPAGTRFLLYTPPGYSPDKPHPLLLVLHGQGGMGDDIGLLLKHRDEIPARLIALNRWPSRYPFIVVTPQLKRDESVPDPADQNWPPGVVDEVVEHVRANYAVNSNKVYVTGLSLGGHGSYLYAAAYPRKVAAVVMVSGVPDTTIACQVKDIPLWTFHGSEDGLVPQVFSTGLVRSINACSPRGKFRPRLSMLYGRKHEGWNETYNNSNGYDIYDWMLKFTKNDPSNTAPDVNAGTDLTLAARNGSIHLYGEVFDSDGTISRVTWTRIKGPEVAMSDIHSTMLKLTGATPGTYEFELTATDDDGVQASDRVELSIVSGTGTSPAVTGLNLLNGNTQEEIAPLHDGYVIHAERRITAINITATVSGDAGSVRFRVNGNENAKTVARAPYALASPRWSVGEGEYFVCATPFSGENATGTRGVSQCYKVVLSHPPPPPPPAASHFFAKPGADISLLTSWSSTPDGAGDVPASFSAKGQTFDVAGPAVLNNPMAIAGTGSALRVRRGGELAINSSLDATIHMTDGAILQVNTGYPITPGSLHLQSVVNFNAGAEVIPVGHYGQVNILGTGSEKKLAPGTVDIANTLTVEEGVRLEGATGGRSVLKVSGDVRIDTGEDFSPAQSFTFIFDKGKAQYLNLRAPRFALHQVVITPGTTLEVHGPPSGTRLELGSDTGGGLTVESGAALLLGKNALRITGKGSLNPQSQRGRIAFSNAHFSIMSSTAEGSNLHPMPGADSLRSLSADLGGTGTLTLHGPLHALDEVHPVSGIIHSNGYLTLVSGRDGTARVVTGDGKILGDVIFQRFMPGGKQRRYISLPVSGVTVADLQQSVPITGSFGGASPDTTGGASLFSFQEQRGGWIPFPENTIGETFAVGRGYALRTSDDRDVNLAVAGALLHEPLSYELSPNAGNNPENGWNLIGNPYAAPMRWNPAALSLKGTGSAIYVLESDDRGERYLVWDGNIGDPELGGIIAQGQGFLVRTISDAPSLTIDNGVTTDTSANFLRRKRSETNTGSLVVTLKQDDVLDRAYVTFSEGADNRFEKYDAVKRRNSYFSISTLSDDSVSLAINYQKQSYCDRTIPLIIEGAAPGTYSLMFDPPVTGGGAAEVALRDLFTNRTLNLREKKLYTFEITADPRSADQNRFVIEMPSGTEERPVIVVDENLLSSSVPSGNQWIYNDREIAGATSATYVPLTSGEYRVRVTLDGCTRISDPVAVRVTVTGLQESRDHGVHIYPNPARDFIRVRLAKPSPCVVHYAVTNAIGLEVIKGEAESAAPTGGIEIDVSRLPPGVYFINFLCDGLNAQEKIIVDP